MGGKTQEHVCPPLKHSKGILNTTFGTPLFHNKNPEGSVGAGGDALCSGGGVYRRQGSSLTRGYARAQCCDTVLLLYMRPLPGSPAAPSAWAARGLCARRAAATGWLRCMPWLTFSSSI
jgi:hypothetical protein